MNLSFNLIDFLVVAVILVSAGYAAWRGFVSETLSIFAWAAAAFATLYFGPWVVPLARDLISTPWLGSLAAYAGVFLIVLIPLAFISHRFSESVKHSALGPLDRALGIAFGPESNAFLRGKICGRHRRRPGIEHGAGPGHCALNDRAIDLQCAFASFCAAGNNFHLCRGLSAAKTIA